MLFSEVTIAKSFEKRNLGNQLADTKNNLIDMHLIKFLKYKFIITIQTQAELLVGYDVSLRLEKKLTTNDWCYYGSRGRSTK